MASFLQGRALAATLLCSVLAACGGGGDGGVSAIDTTQRAAQRPVDLPVCPAPPAPLNDIGAVQGEEARSPVVGDVVTVRGVVTDDQRGPGGFSGFYIQSPVPDRNPRTSDAVFVFAGSAPGAVGNLATLAVGDYVQVTGRVGEFPDDPGVESLTQISGVSAVQRCGSVALPEPLNMALPVEQLSEFERMEGMRVQFRQPLVVSGHFTLGRFGELVLASERLYHPNNHPVLSADAVRDFNPRAQIVLDDGFNFQNPNPIPFLSDSGTDGTRRPGDRVRGLQGILTWGFDAWRLQPEQAPLFEARNLRPAAPPPVDGTLKVASLNVLNYFTTLDQRGAESNPLRLQPPPAPDIELLRQQDKLVATLVGLDADVLGLIEIENNGPVALQRLVDAVNARLGGPVYAFRDAGMPGTDAIKQAVIYKTARVQPVGNPVVPDDPDFIVAGGLRPPVAQRFAAVANGGGFWFVVVHHKSKGSCPSNTSGIDADNGQGCWNESRVRQSQALLRWVNDLGARSGETDVLMAGDFNAYLREDPLNVLRDAGYENLLDRLPAEGRYTYQFDSESGALDHALASAGLRAQVSGVGVWHTNADEPVVLDYNLNFKTDDRYAPTPFRASDHDPVLVGLTLSPDAPALAPVLGATLPRVAEAGQTVSIESILTQTVPGLAASLTVDWGDGSAVQTLSVMDNAASHVYAAQGSYTITVRLSQPGQIDAVVTGRIGVSAPVVVVPQGDLFFSEYVEGSSNNKALEIHRQALRP